MKTMLINSDRSCTETEVLQSRLCSMLFRFTKRCFASWRESCFFTKCRKSTCSSAAWISLVCGAAPRPPVFAIYACGHVLKGLRRQNDLILAFRRITFAHIPGIPRASMLKIKSKLKNIQRLQSTVRFAWLARQRKHDKATPSLITGQLSTHSR